jgi:aspartate/methionine/tyrosine aminotransferase
MQPARRLDGIEISLIRQINALATPATVNLGIGEPNLEPDETFREMARRASTTNWQYSANAGSLELRRRIASAFAPQLDPRAEVCVTAGTGEGLYALFQTYVNPGDEVLVPNPGFLVYPSLARLAGAVPVSYDLDSDGWRLDPAEFERRVTPRTRMIVVNSPSNPLGSVVNADVLDWLGRLADERDLLIVSDEVYRRIYYGAEPPSMIGRARNAVVVDGFSKSHGMTGLRLGWMLAREELMAPMVRTHQYIATCASVFSQALAEQIFGDPDWNRSWLERMRRQFEGQRRVALDAIERELEARISPPQGAFYAFVPVPFRESVDLAKSLAVEAAVLAIPGVAFGSAGEGFIRISFAASFDEIESGIGRIGRYLRQRAR